MPKQQRSQGKGKPKLKDRGFGAALIKSRIKTSEARFQHPVGTEGKKGLISELDNEGRLDEYLKTVEMEDADAEVLHVYNHDAILIEPTQRKPAIQALTNRDFEIEQLSIPRKPGWTRDLCNNDSTAGSFTKDDFSSLWPSGELSRRIVRL